MTRLHDDILHQIASGSGRCYPYEGKYMAQEILERRTKEAADAKAAAAASAATQLANAGMPYPFTAPPPPPNPAGFP